MGLLDGSKTKQLEYLEQERKELWKRVTSIEKSIHELDKKLVGTATESASNAAQASRKAAEYRNRAEQRLEESVALLGKIAEQYEAAITLKKSIENTSNEASRKNAEIDELKEGIDETDTELVEKFNELDSKIERINAFLIKYPDLESRLEDVDRYISSIEENLEKSNVSLTAVNKRKKEIDDLYREIFGYNETNASGQSIRVEGLRDDLESSYENLSEKLQGSTQHLEALNVEYSDKFVAFEKAHKQNYESINREIRSLLPNALTAGLSAAFSTKKENEVEASKELQSNFNRGIYLLLAISSIPVIVSIIFLRQGLDLAEIIRRLPRLVLAIIPMYIPALWFTISANKKFNLSKRLIEEYSHKEVLSKTYEGLSTQIASIGDKEQSEELRFKLLSNFLQVTSENPGKLISNYETSDHPIMEALEQSYKFQIAIDKLEGVPGLGKVAAILESKSRKRLNDRKEKIEQALNKDIYQKEEEEEA